MVDEMWVMLIIHWWGPTDISIYWYIIIIIIINLLKMKEKEEEIKINKITPYKQKESKKKIQIFFFQKIKERYHYTFGGQPKSNFLKYMNFSFFFNPFWERYLAIQLFKLFTTIITTTKNSLISLKYLKAFFSFFIFMWGKIKHPPPPQNNFYAGEHILAKKIWLKSIIDYKIIYTKLKK